jgi:hypothetical protein
VRARTNGTFYSELRAGGFRLTLGTYNTPELAARAYDAAAWRLGCPRRDLNFPDVQSLAEAEFLAPDPHLATDEDRRRHRHAQRRLLIAERDERLMQQWREEFPGDVRDEEAFFAMKREERRADRRRRREYAERELENPNTTEDFEDEDGQMFNDLWTETTSDDDE